MLGILLIIIGLVVWLATGLFWVFLICLILGLVLIVVPGVPYGYSTWRRGPP